jgi:adenylate cyclase
LKRKLTTILFADAEGYSALMSADEAGTLDRLQRCRSMMHSLFERREGRQVNTWGDAVIAEFASPVEAVRCAVEIQDALSGENRDLPKSRQMRFRIGINLGDVMVDRDDLYGDGVNIAARLQGLAEPGGIVVSGTVYTMARKQLAIGFDFVGNQEVKNLDEPVASYRVRMAGRNLPETVPDEPATSHATIPTPQSVFGRVAWNLERSWDWLGHQSKAVRFSAFMIAFFFTINLLFSGIANPWFIYPSLPFALVVLLSIRRGERRRRTQR